MTLPDFVAHKWLVPLNGPIESEKGPRLFHGVATALDEVGWSESATSSLVEGFESSSLGGLRRDRTACTSMMKCNDVHFPRASRPPMIRIRGASSGPGRRTAACP